MRILWLFLCLGALAWCAELRVGAGAVKITPPAGVPMAGYYNDRTADGVHDDLWAKAAVFDDGATRVALVACDVIHLPQTVVAAARRLITERTKVPGANAMISATHAHTGPVIKGGALRYSPQGRAAEILDQYMAALPGLIADAVKAAEGNLQPARVAAGVGQETSVAFNRRFYMVDGTVGWNPGKRNPKIVKPAGPIDPDVAVVYAASATGAPLLTYWNHALHLDTVGGMQISADYPFTAATVLGKAMGAGMVTMFTNGCSGNVNHIDVSSAAPQKGNGEAARIGTVLAGEVLKTYTRAQPAGAAGIFSAAEVVRLPLAELNEADLPRAREAAATFGKPKAAPFLELVRAFRMLEVAGRNGAPLEAEVQVIAVGRELAFVSLPGEIFVELGLAIKQGSPFRTTVVAELANGALGYIPNRKAHFEGAYEVESARCAAGSGELLVEAALRLLGRANRELARR